MNPRSAIDLHGNKPVKKQLTAVTCRFKDKYLDRSMGSAQYVHIPKTEGDAIEIRIQVMELRTHINPVISAMVMVTAQADPAQHAAST